MQGLKSAELLVLKWLLCGLIVRVLLELSPVGRDDSDANQGWGGGRSGMTPMTDARTGCQYLKAPGGGITPRMTTGGAHMGCGS